MGWEHYMIQASSHVVSSWWSDRPREARLESGQSADDDGASAGSAAVAEATAPVAGFGVQAATVNGGAEGVAVESWVVLLPCTMVHH